MPASDLVLLPLCIGLALIGVIVAGVAWRKGSRGRVLQGIGLALTPVALYFTGLLRLVWDAIVAVVGWASSIIFTPSMWFGIALLGLCVVLWVIGGLLLRRATPTSGTSPSGTGSVTSRASGSEPAVGTGRPSPSKPGVQQPRNKSATSRPPAEDVDPEMAEIEAILKNRGIQ